MSHLHFRSKTGSHVLSFVVIAGALLVAGIGAAQTPPEANGSSSAPSGPVVHASSSKAAAYYHFSLGHLYEELAGAYGNRSDYVNKAIENYRLAMKEDPSASFLVEDIAELYRMSGRIREAVEEAESALKANPDDLNARRVLAHVYTQQIGDAQANHVDESMARRAIEQYKLITDKDPKDVDSLIMLGRLENLVHDSVDAEAAFKKVLATDADNEDALTGLANVYSDRNDPKTASQLLEKLVAKNPSPRSLVILASDYEQMRQFGLAADTYKKALDLDPSRVEL
ncbi:MAG: tetratricopeptide repeat protein, partial [Acidobacteriaceae bacterium]|nr:tetratricopeptide repeat protein [Acidobacteriaceae bacterium]